jgi:hypothetical protein
MIPPVDSIAGGRGEWEAPHMVVSLLPKTPSQRTDDHHFAYPVVRPLPRPTTNPASGLTTW